MVVKGTDNTPCSWSFSGLRWWHCFLDIRELVVFDALLCHHTDYYQIHYLQSKNCNTSNEIHTCYNSRCHLFCRWMSIACHNHHIFPRRSNHQTRIDYRKRIASINDLIQPIREFLVYHLIWSLEQWCSKEAFCLWKKCRWVGNYRNFMTIPRTIKKMMIEAWINDLPISDTGLISVVYVVFERFNKA